MSILIAAFLGIIQGLTEFLPVSSTGHLVVFERLFGISQERFGLTFDASLHLGTLLAVLIYFRRDIRALLKLEADAIRMWTLIFVGIVPAVFFGLFFEGIVATLFRSYWFVAFGILFGSAIFLWAERIARQERNFSSFGFADAVIVGLAQLFSFIPGVSRSGITIAAGLGLGLRREAVARFSFLMAIPLFAGAGAKRLAGIDVSALVPQDLLFFAVGITAAAISGYLVIAFLMRYLVNHSLIPFVWYRVLFLVFVLASVLVLK